MSKRKSNYGKKVGKGIDKDTMRKMKTAGGTNLTVYEVNKNAWQAFYASDQGKNRLRRMAALNEAKIQRLRAIQQGNSLSTIGTAKEVYQEWEDKQDTYNQQAPQQQF